MNKIFALILSMVFSIHCFSDEVADTQLWECLYNNDSSLSHKLLLTRESKSTSDEMLTYLMFVYRAYKMGDEQQVRAMLNSVDQMVELRYILPKK
jgi:hypothetical protein